MKTDFFNTTVAGVHRTADGSTARRRLAGTDPSGRPGRLRAQLRRRSTRASPFRWSTASGAPTTTYRWVLDTGVPRYGPDGSFAGYIGSALDITERREMEQSLLDNQAALRRSYEENRDLAGRLINAQEAERTRIARDLHDDVSQQLAGVAIMLSGLKRSVGKPDAQREVDRDDRDAAGAHLSAGAGRPEPLARTASERAAARRPGGDAEAVTAPRSQQHHAPQSDVQRRRRSRRAQSGRRALPVPGGAGGAHQRRPPRARAHDRVSS